MQNIIYAIISVLVVSSIALIGLFALSIKENTLRKILIYLVSFSTGALLADAFIHLLPEAVEESGFTLSISIYILLGIIFSFIVEKIIHWHHCHHTHSEECLHEHEHAHEKIHIFAKMNLIGDSVHNFIDGLIIGASYLVSIPVGIATTLAVILHEIPQEIGDFGILLHGGYTKKKALTLNFVTGLIAVLGALAALFIGHYTEHLTEFLIPFAAGGFIYIAGSDLMPEMHKETNTKKSLIQLFTFILGIAIIAAMLLVE